MHIDAFNICSVILLLDSMPKNRKYIVFEKGDDI